MDDAREGLDERVASVSPRSWRNCNPTCAISSGRRRSPATRRRGTVGRLTARREARAAIETRLAAASRELAESERQEAELARRAGGSRRARRHRWPPSTSACAARSTERDDADRRTRGRSPRMRTPPPSADDERSAALDARARRAVDGPRNRTTAIAAVAEPKSTGCIAPLGEASTRLEVLRRMHESGAGLHARRAGGAGGGTRRAARRHPGHGRGAARGSRAPGSRHRGRAGEPPAGRRRRDVGGRRGGDRPPEAIGRGPRHLSAAGYRARWPRRDALADAVQRLPGVLRRRRGPGLGAAGHRSGRCRAAGTDAGGRRPGDRARGAARISRRAGASSPSPARSPAPVAR